MNIIIIGAGGHSQVVMEALVKDDNYNVIGYLDDNIELQGKILYDKPVLGKIEMLGEMATYHVEGAIVAIGDNTKRKEFSKYVEDMGLQLINAIHYNSTISQKATVGKGIYIGPNVVIGPNVTIGNSVIINAGTCLPHNNKVGDYVNISPNVCISGGTIIGKETFIGIGVSLVQYITIGCNAVIGAGSVIINDIPDYAKAIGVPGKLINFNENRRTI